MKHSKGPVTQKPENYEDQKYRKYHNYIIASLGNIKPTGEQMLRPLGPTGIDLI